MLPPCLFGAPYLASKFSELLWLVLPPARVARPTGLVGESSFFGGGRVLDEGPLALSFGVFCRDLFSGDRSRSGDLSNKS